MRHDHHPDALEYRMPRSHRHRTGWRKMLRWLGSFPLARVRRKIDRERRKAAVFARDPPMSDEVRAFYRRHLLPNVRRREGE